MLGIADWKNVSMLHRAALSLFLVGLIAGPGALSATAAPFKVGSYFADHMVVQREHPVVLLGEGEPGASVEVTADKQSVNAIVGPDGRWLAKLEALPVGGPYTLTAKSGAASATFSDVLSGDVWLCSGQSNMQWPIKETPSNESATKSASKYPKLRVCLFHKTPADTPLLFPTLKWSVATPESVANMTAVGYLCVKDIIDSGAAGDVPMAVVDCSLGATLCEGWIPAAALAQFDKSTVRTSLFGSRPSSNYNAMIAPLGGNGFKGVLWYQGESNAGQPWTYFGFLTTMIAEWRKQFDQPTLPFFIVQLPEFTEKWEGLYWPWIREVQAQVAAKTPHTYLASGLNTNDGRDLHPPDKSELARRLALLARDHVYNQKVVSQGPVLKDAKADGEKLRVTFETYGDGLASSDKSIHGFVIAGDDQQYWPAQATIDGDSVVLTSARVPQPKTARYAWSAVPRSTLTNKSGLPAHAFRTDAFAAESFDVRPDSVSQTFEAKDYAVTISGTGKVVSFTARGQQFISNSPGSHGATSLGTPDGHPFGVKTLQKFQALTDKVVSCTNDAETLEVAFGSNAMTWTVTSGSKVPLKFKIMLASGVTAATASDKAIALKRKQATVEVRGIDTVNDGDEGKVLEVTLGPKEKKVIEFRIGN